MLTQERKRELEALCGKFRVELIEQLHSIQTGHPGGSLSICEFMTALYFEKATVTPQNPKAPERDRIILSKGHAAPMLYLILGELGFFPKSDFKNLRQFGCHLQGHPCSLHTPGVEISAGPLGMGLSVGVGKALSLKQDKNDAQVYVILGDGELNEGTIWEAAMAANKFKTANLTAIVDRNGVQLDGTSDDIMPLGPLDAKWRAFGWNVLECDGHDLTQVCDAIDAAKAYTQGPTVIIANTVKGKGVSFMEGKNIWHGSPISADDYKQAIQELGKGA